VNGLPRKAHAPRDLRHRKRTFGQGNGTKYLPTRRSALTRAETVSGRDQRPCLAAGRLVSPAWRFAAATSAVSMLSGRGPRPRPDRKVRVFPDSSQSTPGLTSALQTLAPKSFRQVGQRRHTRVTVPPCRPVQAAKSPEMTTTSGTFTENSVATPDNEPRAVHDQWPRSGFLEPSMAGEMHRP
jgi:hypothetical protein